MDQQASLQSVAKSYFSALVGIAEDQGCLSRDERMMDYFPEYEDAIDDPRKSEITIEQLLQMRSGYLWEETDPDAWERFLRGDHLPLLVEYDLVDDPGTDFNYSNLTSFLLGVIVSRACGVDLPDFAAEYLLDPIGARMDTWHVDDDGNYYSVLFRMPVTSRSSASSASTRESSVGKGCCRPTGSTTRCASTRAGPGTPALVATSATSATAISGGPPAPAITSSTTPGDTGAS
jgi:CubicO group peptidase (beta-lactamase class C family)